MNSTIAWTLVVGAGLLEIVWGVALKHSAGLTRPLPATVAVLAAVMSFGLLAVALRSLPLAVGYSVWVGIGAVGVAVAGALLFGEHLSPSRTGCILLIGLGVVGLHALETR